MTTSPHNPGSAAGSPVTRRRFLGLAGASVAGLAAASCRAAPRGPGAHGSEKVQLVYQDWRTEWFPAMAQAAIEKFQEANPNIRVFYTPDPEDVEDRMLADMQAGTAPDVMAGCCDFFHVWAQRGFLLDLRPYVEADLDAGTLRDWDPAQVAALTTRSGQQFALPKYHGALGLFFNRDIFDARHVDYPDRSWTHDDYGNAMLALKRAAVEGGSEVWGSMADIAWERIQVHINGWGGHLVDPEDPTLSLMGEPEALAAMGWLRDRMWQDRVMASALDVNNLETRQAFVEGRLAMVEDGSWSLKDILEEATFPVGVTTFPAGPVRRATLATTDGFAIYAGTKYPEAAWEFLKYVTSPDYGRAMVASHLLQPARSSLVDEWVATVQQEYPAQTADMDLASFAQGHLEGSSVTAEVFANMEAARDLTRAAWQEIFTLGRAPVERMRAVSDAVQAAQSSRGDA